MSCVCIYVHIIIYICDMSVSLAGHPDLGKLAREVVAKIGSSGECEEGVCPTWVNPHSGTVHGDKLSLGSRGDSYYEYLLKHWILTGKKDKALLRYADDEHQHILMLNPP